MNEELKKKLAEWVWETVERRYGFVDEGGYFMEMQSNPYSNKKKHHSTCLCYLEESRDLTEEEQMSYQEDFDKGLVKFIPAKTELWESVPDFPESLDACFKWLRLKFISMACGSLNEEGWKGAWAKVIAHDRKTSDIREEGIEPALALCLAIEKLIDECIQTGAMKESDVEL